MKLNHKNILVLLGLGVLCFASLFIQTLSSRWHMIMGLGFFLIGVLCVAYVHELAHYVAAKKLGASDIAMHASVKGFYVSYNTNTSARRALISAAGPLCGVCIGIIGLMFASLLYGGQALAATWLGLVSIIACLQGLFLLPFVQDGAVLWASTIDVLTSKGVPRETK